MHVLLCQSLSNLTKSCNHLVENLKSPPTHNPAVFVFSLRGCVRERTLPAPIQLSIAVHFCTASVQKLGLENVDRKLTRKCMARTCLIVVQRCGSVHFLWDCTQYIFLWECNVAPWAALKRAKDVVSCRRKYRGGRFRDFLARTICLKHTHSPIIHSQGQLQACLGASAGKRCDSPPALPFSFSAISSAVI